jgi:hypothetical protein
MASVKATLTVVLKANDLVVAEVEDAQLWQRILTVINGGKSELRGEPEREPELGSQTPTGQGESKSRVEFKPSTSPLDLFSQQIGIDRAVLEGGCSPTDQQPYILLNPHCWEEMKRQLPKRGPGSVAPIVAAATALALWFQAATLGTPTQAQAQAVLATINLRDPNASRSIGNATWIQTRSGGQFVINPAEISRACALVRCFCNKDWKTWKEAAVS